MSYLVTIPAANLAANIPAGYKGQVLTANSAGVSFNALSFVNVVSLTLTKGFWLVDGLIASSGSTNVGSGSFGQHMAISTTSANFDTYGFAKKGQIPGPGNTFYLRASSRFLNVTAATQTIYLVSRQFSGGAGSYVTGTYTTNSFLSAVRMG